MKVKEKEYRPVSTFSKVMMALVLALTVVLAALCVLDRVGYSLIKTNLVMLGSGLLLLCMIVWGLVALIRKIRKNAVRIAVGTIAFMVLFMLASVALTLVSYFSEMWLPSKYSVLTSESGKSVVVMKLLDTGIYDGDDGAAAAQRMMERREYILSQPDAEPLEDDEMPSGAYGYVYRAYPRVLGVFYKAKADCEGAIFRGMESESTMRYEWLEDGSLHLYLENAEVGDSGEIVLH